MDKDAKVLKDAPEVKIDLSEDQRKEIARAFGDDIAKKVGSVVVTRAGSGLVSVIVVN